MKIILKKKSTYTINKNENLIVLIDKKSNLDFLNLSKSESQFLKIQLKKVAKAG